MTDFDTPIQEPKRDRYGRYLLPDPDGGKELPWTRATTFARAISDSFGLTRWELRMAVKGVATRPDLYALAAATPIEDKTRLDKVAADAKEAAAASSGANLGSALHAFTERLDRGETLTVPEPWAADVAAYQRALAGGKVTIDSELVERIVVIPQLRVAGTFDRVVWLSGVVDRQHIADVKTGKDLSYAWLEIAVQLALYAHGAAMWNPTSQTYESMPAVDENLALVMHLPAGQGRCDLYDIDIAAGWQAAQVCREVRTWRTASNLATPRRADPIPALRAGLPSTVEEVFTSVEELSALIDRAIDEAPTIDELITVWMWADTAGQWTPAHTARAAARKAALLAPTGV